MSGHPPAQNFTEKPLVTDMLDSIVKKDADVRILEYDSTSGAMQLETSVDLTQQNFCTVEPEQESPIDTSLLRDYASGASSDVPIRIIFTVFSVMTAVHFVTATIGILFYLVLLYDESKLVAIVVCSISATLCGVLYVLMSWQRKTYLGPIFLGQLAFMRILVVASVSQLIGNELLYLLEVVYLFQAAVVIVYTTKWPKNDSAFSSSSSSTCSCLETRFGGTFTNAYNSKYANVAFLWVLATTTLVWAAGVALFARVFFRELIWLWGTLFYLLAVCICVYKWRYIGNMIYTDGDRYSVSTKDRKLATIEYYSNPLVSIWNKILAI